MLARLIIIVLLAVAGVATKPAMASAVCPNSNLLSGALMNKFCWSCIFPIRVVGAKFGSGSIPDGARNSAFCKCKNHMGIYQWGYSVAGWLPTRLVETVRTPWCSPVLGQTLMNAPRLMGGRKSTTNDNSDKTFYHTHYVAFPIAYMLQMLISDSCSQGNFMTMAHMSFSEIDPTKQRDELAMWFNPMSVVFSTPAAYIAAMADCTASTAGRPLSDLPGCMGCLGMLTPGANHVNSAASPPSYTALMAGREIMTAHMRGFAKKTYGSSEAMCGGQFWPIIPKEQYRISQFYPVPQATKPCCDTFGQSPMTSREFRNIPGVGEDFVYIVFQYTECCAY